jgi:hypothetical protein
MWHKAKSFLQVFRFCRKHYQGKHLPGYVTTACFSTNAWRWIRRRWNVLSTWSFHPLQLRSTKWPSYKISWSFDWKRQVNTVDPTKSRTLNTAIFLWRFTTKSRLHRKSEIYLICERQLTSCYSENASTNMARSSVPSKCLQGRKRC